MCGIAGILSRDESAVRRSIAAMISAQRHRGPDGCGDEITPSGVGHLGLGHTRLAIIDLSETGTQPMIHPRTGAVLIFNGEIYNFLDLRKELIAKGISFRGTSDSEVLLHALSEWGPAALERLHGMFALAYYDPRDNTLLLARDPLGIKPLYLATAGRVMAFASEVRALVATGLFTGRINHRAVGSYLAYGSVQGPDTIYSDIGQFPPGSWQRWDLTTATSTAPRRFWTFPEPREFSEAEAAEAVRHTLEEAVRTHLISDVPVGILLSSGIDSTIVATLAARESAEIRSFTVGFAEHEDFSELATATATAKRLGTRHTNIRVTNDEARTSLTSWLRSLDQPSMDGWNVYTVCQTVRQHDIRVALSGQGGDELFGGYSSFVDVPRALAIHGRMGLLPRGARGALASLGRSLSSSGRVGKAADMLASDGSLVSLYLNRRRTLSDEQMKQLGVTASSLNLNPQFAPPEVLAELPLSEHDHVANISKLESTFYLGNMLLRDSDTNGMAHSLELRVPMLDTALLNLAFAIPGSVRLPNRRADKHLLRVAFGELLSESQLQGPKRGFHLPVGRWMAGPLREFCEASLAELPGSLGLSAAGVRRIWNTFLRDPNSVMWSRAWELCVLGSYLGTSSAAAAAA